VLPHAGVDVALHHLARRVARVAPTDDRDLAGLHADLVEHALDRASDEVAEADDRRRKPRPLRLPSPAGERRRRSSMGSEALLPALCPTVVRAVSERSESLGIPESALF